MDLLRKAQRNVGSGLKGTGRRDLLAEALEEERQQRAKEVPVTTVTFNEPAELRVWVDSDTQRPATLRLGDVVPYTVEEMAERKDTEFAVGMKQHVFRGTLRPGTSVRDGPGSLHYASGDLFIGTFRNHHKSGLGIWLSPTGYAVEGHFQSDHAHGLCLERYPGGDVYLGEFVAGVPHGRGVLYYARNGSRYEGGFEKGEKHGEGVVFYENGDVFQGSWLCGQREGHGITTYASTGRSYASNWRDDEADFKTTFVQNPPQVVSKAAPLREVTSPLGVDMRAMTPMPSLVTELHDAVFLRIKAAFEAMDADCAGEVDLQHLRTQWMEGSDDTAAGLVTNDSLAGFRLDAGSFAGTPSRGAADQNIKNGETLVALQRASQNGVTLTLSETLGVLVPRLPEADLRRVLTTDITPETVLRLRGVVAGVVAKHQDTFAALSEHAAADWAAGSAIEASLDAAATGSKSAGGKGGASKGPLVVTQERLQANRLVVGGLKVSQSAFLRVAAVDGTPHGAVTFPQLLRQLYPHLAPGAAERTDVDSLPVTVLRRYARDFDRLDALQQHHLGIERLKAAQRRWQLRVANGHAAAMLSPSMADMRAPGSPSASACDALDKESQPGFWRHSPSWSVGDIELTVTLAKLVDRHRTGWVSLLDLLRFCYPNIPCLSTRERLGQSVRAEEQCACVLCAFCGPRYMRPRPPSPYVDGSVAW
jgi:hypothetical protein